MIKWVSIPEYTKQTGLNRGAILKMIESGELISTQTESGAQLRVKIETDPELDRLNQQLKENNELIKMLCAHLGIKDTRTKYF